MIDSKTKIKIEQIVNCFETGSPEGDYSDVTLYHDGPNQLLQITAGKAGVTEYGGNLEKVLTAYVNKNGKKASVLKPYISKIGSRPSVLAVDKDFIALLKELGHDNMMHEAQDEIFDSEYWIPAQKFFTSNGFTLPLSMLVIYDSYIHSGSVPMFLRNRFAEKTPANGGDERTWIDEYVSSRFQWLKFHSNPILRETVYRTALFKKLSADDNWNLDGTINANGENVN
jgi:chitosanase